MTAFSNCSVRFSSRDSWRIYLRETRFLFVNIYFQSRDWDLLGKTFTELQ